MGRLASSGLRAQPVPTSKIPDTNATLESADLSEGYVVGPDSQTVTLIHSGRVCAISLGWRFSRYEVGLGGLKGHCHGNSTNVVKPG